MNLQPVLERVLQAYTLPLNGVHGVAHWARVLQNGLELAEHTGATLEVVYLFAVLHDSQRYNEGSDPQHGPRAAEFAKSLRGSVIHLDDAQFQLLYLACEGHTHMATHKGITIQTCWDSDRLDLGRVGITPCPTRLCTDHAKLAETIHCADRRAENYEVPAFVETDWGILLPN